MISRALIVFAAAGLLAANVSSAIAAGDPQEGEKVFRKCAACHSNEPGKNKIGPSLYGVVGRKAGTEPGFKYSDAMKNSGLTWDEQTLDTYLAKPQSVVKGTKMTFTGLPKEEDRENVIAYLKTLK